MSVTRTNYTFFKRVRLQNKNNTKTIKEAGITGQWVFVVEYVDSSKELDIQIAGDSLYHVTVALINFYECGSFSSVMYFFDSNSEF